MQGMTGMWGGNSSNIISSGGTDYKRFYINKVDQTYKLDVNSSSTTGYGPYSNGTLGSSESPGYSMTSSGSNEMMGCGWNFVNAGATTQAFKVSHSGANKKLWLIGIGHGSMCAGSGGGTRALDMLVINGANTSGSTLYKESGVFDLGQDLNANYSMCTHWLGDVDSTPTIGSLEDISDTDTLGGVHTGTKGLQLYTNNTYVCGWHWESGYNPNMSPMKGAYYQGKSGTHNSNWDMDFYAQPDDAGTEFTYEAIQPTRDANSDFPNITTNNGSDQARGQIWSMAFAIEL